MSLHRLRRADVLPAVGRDAESWCTACRRMLDHVITAMDGTAIVQVRCRTCGSVHRYKGAESAKVEPAAGASERSRERPAAAAKADAKAAPGRPPTQRPAVNAERVRYERMLGERDRAAALEYAPTLAPKVGDLLRHARFGYGFVEAVEVGKAHILFADGVKLLVVGR